LSWVTHFDIPTSIMKTKPVYNNADYEKANQLDVRLVSKLGFRIVKFEFGLLYKAQILQHSVTLNRQQRKGKSMNEGIFDISETVF